MHLFTTTVESLWKVVAIGLLFGAGLPLVFALGVRFSSVSGSNGTAAARRSPVGYAAGVACFAIVAIAVLIGILYIAKDFIDHTFGISLF